MDRIDAMKVFVAALDEGGLAKAGRRLGKSPAAVSRAIAFLEAHVGAELLHRTTRSLRLSEAGERYAAACRRILTELEEADILAAGERAAPRGLLTITAAVAAGEAVLGPIIADFLDAYPEVSVRLHLLDRQANLVEEGLDLALRTAHLPDSSLTAVRVGQVRRVVAAAPAYLARHPPIDEPADLAGHSIVAMSHFGLDSWRFAAAPGSAAPRVVSFTPRLIVNGVREAVELAAAGKGVARLFSYHLAPQVRSGALSLLLEDFEPPPLPVHLVAPQGRMQAPKVRAFVDFALERLKARFAGYEADLAR
ncbi:MAG: LysR family transcriptional regulator [Caulobacteraceae bacterium]|nr:LysR family transcriptional regulator [Caulobacteraceae bacterium]